MDKFVTSAEVVFWVGCVPYLGCWWGAHLGYIVALVQSDFPSFLFLGGALGSSWLSLIDQ